MRIPGPDAQRSVVVVTGVFVDHVGGDNRRQPILEKASSGTLD